MANNSFIAPSSPLDRRHLGKFEVLCRLSTGGMSAIFLAHQTGLAGFKKLVVLKTILPDIGGEEDFVGMFLEEARITAAFNHPNIAQVFELDTDDGQLFMAMEFVQGCTLVEMARACRQAKEAIPLGLTLATTRDTALALHYAHNFTDARGRKQIVIHRDVAEKNIMVTYEGVTKLLDFGIAKALGRSGRTSIGMVKGTSGYMSPEQIRGEPLDPRSDIFALGVVMHELLTGLRLFHGKTAEEGMMAALREEVQPPSKWNKEVSPELDAVVLKALQRDREKRFTTALEFARAIEKAAPGLLWHPEQCGEVVTRHFADRRIETRRLLESSEFGAETTGELRVQNVLAKVRASANQPSPSAPDPKPGDTPRRASLVTAPKVSLPNENDELTRPAVMGEIPGPVVSAPRASLPRPGNESTRPGVMPSELAAPVAPPANDRPTNPARPKVLRGTDKLTSPGEPALQRSYDDDDDDVGDKTIPAAALPDEIKNLRAQFQAARRNAPAVAPAPDASTQRDRVLTDRVNVDVTPSAPAPVVARTTSSDTLSITNRAASPMDWDDDDGAKTAIARPNELPGLVAARAAARRPAPSPLAFDAKDVQQPPSGTDFQPTDDRAAPAFDSLAELQAVKPRRTGLILLLLVLAALAVLGTLILLDVLPLPQFGPGHRVGSIMVPHVPGSLERVASVAVPRVTKSGA